MIKGLISRQTREETVFMVSWDVKENLNKILLKLGWDKSPVKGVREWLLV